MIKKRKDQVPIAGLIVLIVTAFLGGCIFNRDQSPGHTSPAQSNLIRPTLTITPEEINVPQPIIESNSDPDELSAETFLPISSNQLEMAGPEVRSLPTISQVLIISLDGFRPDAIYDQGTGKIIKPYLFQLAQSGAVSWSALTTKPTTSIPGHTSMLTGLGVEKHGVDIYVYADLVERDGYLQSPTIFEMVKERGFTTVMIGGKKKFNYLVRPPSQEDWTIIGGKRDEMLNMAVVALAREAIHKDFHLLFVHLPDTDSAGHLYGWMTLDYMDIVELTSQSVKAILDELKVAGKLESTLIIITADHAGHEMGHTSGSIEDLTIPWIILGPGVVPETILSARQIYVMDTAATVLCAFGIEVPTNFDGRPVLEAFGLEPDAPCPMVKMAAYP